MAKFIIPAILSPHAAFTFFRAQCAGVVPVACRADVPVVVANIDAAFRAVTPRVTDMPALLPRLDMKPVLEMPNIGRALLHASGLVAAPTSTGAIADKLADCRHRREPMLATAEVLASMGLVPSERVAKIRAGTGPYDSARDLLDLVALYRDHADDIGNKHPFDAAWLASSESVGMWLLAQITPTGAAKPAAIEQNESAKLRDQLWAMLLTRDVKLRVVASVLFEERAEELVPSLQSRVAARQDEVLEAPSILPGSMPASPI